MECLLSIVPCFMERSAGSAAKHAAFICNLEDNRESLVSQIGTLKSKRDDLSNRVKEAEDNRMKRTNQVNDWLERVKAVEEKADEILPKVARELEKRCLGSCCPMNCKSSYKLGKEVAKMIARVKSLTEEGKFDVVAHKLGPPPALKLNMKSDVVGFESKLEELWQSVQSKDTTVIGLVGMGGVGKTTLLMQLNNKFLEATHEYDVVIWIVVSKPVNVGNIQNTFRNRLNIPNDLWNDKSESERASLIFEKLGRKKFVVLLDDMWERLELSEVGIPHPNKDNMSKVVFTTRSQKAFHSMEAIKLIEVNCLPEDDALRLFRSKVGEGMLKCHQELTGLVKDVARECQGLPLALVTIGLSMRGKKHYRQWEDTKRSLKKHPSDILEVKDQVFRVLVFSYDSLPTSRLKKCFEYCSLYPEDHNIAEDDVIMLWIAERLIDAYDSMDDAFVQGRQVMESLVQAGLLEAGYEEETVKMHDVIRDMSLWLARERGKKQDKILVDVTDGYVVTPAMAERSTDIEKVSLLGLGAVVGSLAGLSLCSNLVTLIVRDTKMKKLSGEVFLNMKVLKVLDLSRNWHLIWLPGEIGGLISLEYLNIMKTDVILLPIEMRQLKKLRFLMVAHKTAIPSHVISSLRLLLMFPTGSQDRQWERDRRSMEEGMLTELEGLERIMHLGLTLKSQAGIKKLLDSKKLQSCISQLCLDTMYKDKKTEDSLPAELDFGLTEQLEKLQVAHCDRQVIKFGRSTTTFYSNIRQVSFVECCNIRNLNSLVHVSSLCILEVRECRSLEELIGEDAEETNEGKSLFPCLTQLDLYHLPELRSICPQSALPFYSLKFMTVIGCDRLRKLPFDSSTATTTPPEFKIKGWEDWWDELEWDSQATKEAFTPKLVKPV